jgi:hypothetical protein
MKRFSQIMNFGGKNILIYFVFKMSTTASPSCELMRQ